MSPASAPVRLLGGCVREETRDGEGRRRTFTGAACRWCRREELEVLRSRGDHQVLRCRCGFLTLRTGIDEARLGETYQDYLPTEPAAIARWEHEQRPVIRRAVRAIRDLLANRGRRLDAPPSVDLLEVGSGFGFFLDAARGAGFRVRGVEFSANGRDHARRRFGIDVRGEPLERAGIGDASFDVVAAFYVIEHLADPRAFLHEIHRVLRPGGLVFLRWPHTTPLARLLDGLGIRHDLYHAPWHLSDFTPATMERALADCAFQEPATRTFGGTASGGPLGSLLSRGAAALSDATELASGSKLHVPGVSKTTFGWKESRAAASHG